MRVHLAMQAVPGASCGFLDALQMADPPDLVYESSRSGEYPEDPRPIRCCAVAEIFGLVGLIQSASR